MAAMERFFQNSSSFDLIEVEELLLHRYSNIDYIMGLEVNEGVLLINKAMEKRREEKHFRMWVAQLPFMDRKSYISFEDYQAQVTGANISTMPVEDALKMAAEIQARVKQMGGE